MRKAIKYISGILGVSGLAFGIYFFVIIHSKGTSTIKYIEPEANYQFFSQLVNHPALRNKVIYVDFWHTGCGPCLIEFKSLPRLKRYYQDRKDLVFLYLGKDRSAPGEKFRWKKMIEEKELSGYHFFMSNEMFYKIWKETVQDEAIMMSFPHYLIVDRQGKIANNNSPRPSSELIINELNKVLNH